MTRLRPVLAISAVFGLLAALPAKTFAGVARALSVDDLVTQSSLVTVGTPLSSQSQWELIGDQKRIVTRTRVHIDQIIRGQASSELTVSSLGGRVGNIGQIVHGEAALALGRPGLMFLRADQSAQYRVTGRSQGYFPLRADKQVGWRLAVSPGLSHLVVGKVRPAASELAGLSLREAMVRIGAAARR
ncbi:MAG TPA: hypothetical protein VGJ84_23150 [Polyangiaceae bacterium]|jgi:hypothetical protein